VFSALTTTQLSGYMLRQQAEVPNRRMHSNDGDEDGTGAGRGQVSKLTNNNPAQWVYAETILENPKETDDALNVDPLRRNRRLFVFVQISFCFESVEDVE